MFAVVRHPEAGLGTAAEAMLPLLESNGWVRVSDLREWPSDFDLDEYADWGMPTLIGETGPELDIPATHTIPAEPEKDEEQ